MADGIYVEELSTLISGAVDRLAKELPVYFIIQDHKIIHECAARASVTLREYNMSGDESLSDSQNAPVALPNFYKEAGHFAYWITRLKPLRLVNFKMISETLKRLGIQYDDAALAAQQERTRRRDLLLLLNEYAAYYVARKIIHQSEWQLFHLLAKGQPADAVAERKSAFVELQERATEKAISLSDYLLQSLRYDTHSPNSLALLFEALLGSGFAFQANAGDEGQEAR